jgi:RHS repeat-associated protein
MEMGSTADGRTKFATYYRDGAGMDYAGQRYYAPGMGRFNTPDPSSGVALGNPNSWNKYAYVNGDPVNRFDPSGLLEADPNDPGSPTVSIGPGFLTGYGPEGPYTYVGTTITVTGPSSQIGTGGGGSNPHGDQFWTTAKTLWKALDLAMTKLDSEQCRGLFGNGSSPDPRDVLKGLLYGTSKYGMVTVNDIVDKPGEVTSATTVVTGLTAIDIGNGATQLVNGKVLITINDLAGNFANGDVKESAATLLHELGHAYFKLDRLLGGSVILDDGGDVAASQENQRLIKKYCF